MSESKKIIVDEDWKSQIAAEKEAAQRQSHESVAERESVAESRRDSSLPEASFELLVTTFATEAMVALGQFPHPTTGRIEADPQHARYAIDMLGIIARKTQGNLSSTEEQGLEEILHQLRMAFVAAMSSAADSRDS